MRDFEEINGPDGVGKLNMFVFFGLYKSRISDRLSVTCRKRAVSIGRACGNRSWTVRVA
jgi:hypothetical protein